MKYQTDLPDKIDSTSQTGVTYLGYAKPGTTATSQASWAIVKVEATGTTYTNGLLSYDQVWDNRLSLTYSIRKF